MKIKLAMICVLLVSAKAAALDFNKVHASFVDAAQGHLSSSLLAMENGAVIIGTKPFNKTNGQYHLDFSKEASSNKQASNSKCYLGLDANGKRVGTGEKCTITDNTGNDYPLGKYTPPLWPYNKDDIEHLPKLKLQEQARNQTIPAGDYFLEKLELNNHTELSVQGSGTVNLYVKSGVVINGGSQLGDSANPINIFNYQDEVEINNEAVMYGHLKTKGDLTINGQSKVHLYGEVEARKLEFDVAELIIGSAEHWFKSIHMGNGARLRLAGEAVLNIEEELEVNDATINVNNKKAEHSLLILLYKKEKHHKDSVNINNEANVGAYIYTRNEVNINDATVYGSVNVGDLIMNEGLVQFQRHFYTQSSSVHHYRLNYEPSSHQLQARACQDSQCDSLSDQPITKLHISDAITNQSLVNFPEFIGQSAHLRAEGEPRACIQFALKDKTQALPYPSAEPPLQCYIGNALLADCKICDEPIPLFGYVQGEAIIPAVSANSNASFTIDSYSGAPGLFEFANNNKLLKVGASITLPLSVSHSQAGQVTLLLSDADSRQYEVQLGFVPKQLVWVSDLDINACGEQDSAFSYAQHAQSCQAQGAVGEHLQFTIAARDINGNKISGYQAELGTIAAINELNEHHQPPSSHVPAPLVVSFNSQNNDSASVNYTPHQVGLMNATIHTHTSPYGKRANGESVLLTEGDTKVLGRSVPHSLKVEGSAGEILNGFAYRAKAVDFSTLPSFLVTGCAKSSDDKCAMLPSYSGEFAKGLAHSANVEFSLTSDPSGPAYTLTGAQGATVSFDQQGVDGQWRSALGQHVIQPHDLLELVFAKENPSSVQKLTQQLRLSLDIPQDSHQHQARPRGAGEAPLDNKDAQLRYGFLTLHDLELATNTAGSLTAHLNYYDQNLNTLKEDDSSALLIPSSLSPFVLKPTVSGLTEPTLTLDDKVITISEYASEWEGAVELSTPDWLKPYDQESCGAGGCLRNPQFHLHITEQSRKRQFDRIFNRREVVR